jgi:hypothetical protein
VASSSTSAPTSITGHDKQPSTVTLLLSPSNHVPSAANASDSPVSESQIAGATQDTPIDLEKLVNECAVTAAEEAVISASYIKESSGEETAPIVDIMREAAVSAALVAARAAVAAVAGTVFFALVRFLHHAGTRVRSTFSKHWRADMPVCHTRVLCAADASGAKISVAGLGHGHDRFGQADGANADQAKWVQALEDLKAKQRSLGNVSDLDDDQAAALLQSLRANAHHNVPGAPPGASNETDARLTRDIVADLQKHNGKLRSELKNVVTDAEQMLKASSTGCQCASKVSLQTPIFFVR